MSQKRKERLQGILWPDNPESHGFVKVTHENKKDVIKVGTILYVAPIDKKYDYLHEKLIGKKPRLATISVVTPWLDSRGWFRMKGWVLCDGTRSDQDFFVYEPTPKETHVRNFKLQLSWIDGSEDPYAYNYGQPGRLYINSKDERVRFDYEKQ